MIEAVKQRGCGVKLSCEMMRTIIGIGKG